MQTLKMELRVQKDIENSEKLSALKPEQLLSFAVTGLNEEAGEVAGLLCREVYKGIQMPRECWLEELGDVLWYLIAASLAHGVSLTELWQYNYKKLEARYGQR